MAPILPILPSPLPLDTLERLLTIVEGILENTTDSNLRKISVDSEMFLSYFVTVPGAMEVLQQLGFEESTQSNAFVLDQTASLEPLKQFLGEVEAYFASPTAMKPEVSRAFLIVGSIREHLLHAHIQPALFQLRTVRQHESRVLRAAARSRIPQDVRNTEGDEAKLTSLLKWFKQDFFSWMNTPDCPNCKVATVQDLTAPSPAPTNEELSWLANRVEGYVCPKCGRRVRFPRYNHPGKLLLTRTGRCGEWANVFTLCARSLGFDTRMVLDSADHVWTEVFSKTENRSV